MDQFHPLSLMLQSKWATFFDITGYPSNSIFISADPDLTWVCYHIWPFVLFVLIDFLQTSLMLKWKTLIGKIWSNIESRLRGERVRYSSSFTARSLWCSLAKLYGSRYEIYEIRNPLQSHESRKYHVCINMNKYIVMHKSISYRTGFWRHNQSISSLEWSDV